MLQIAQRKKASRRYLRLREKASSQRGMAGLRPKSRFPSRQRASLRVPTGQSQLQKPFFRKSPMARIASRMKTEAGWMLLRVPERIQCLRLMRALMGRKPSVPGGRGT
ncbi:MAG: hypothetical protein BWY56_00943 [Acidobacteria bacterium ADurb.Bin340]|nr:MAG: hypothetical protein BWY56_00943 [Acidobacteria bacterium ADurb.Bin340]